ncbi:hypothetical protein Q4574_17655 [Aliiglaciecola sp. 3_MG-2023]|uniref:hypothetical protein n=1 Tax=Aliiglaciecola sp. 3_MG-2023 TaxID=3062644 RepID=UPI0026E2E036|nr:hypothetical protein [Aliiglaciecola sp. 3_MG-2023]MDO6695128.1 hypothetical protein [Aliiglaciecola sp. 3_MG-2023]
MSVYSGRDRYASYSLSYSNRILTGVVTGSIGIQLATQYDRDLTQILHSIADKYFAYVGDFSACQAYTDDATGVVHLTHQKTEKAGCVVDAYCMGTALSREQMRRIRSDAKNPASLDERIFDDYQQCVSFVQSVLAQFESSSEASK